MKKEKYDNSNIRFKISMVRSNICDYSDTYILIKGTLTVQDTAGTGATVNNTNKKFIFKYCTPFTDWIAKINNMQADDAQKIDIVKPMNNLIEYSDAYLKASGVYRNTIELNQL